MENPRLSPTAGTVAAPGARLLWAGVTAFVLFGLLLGGSVAVGQPGAGEALSSMPMGGWMEEVMSRLSDLARRASELFAHLPAWPGEWRTALTRVFVTEPQSISRAYGDGRLWLFVLAMLASTNLLSPLLCVQFSTREGSRFWKSMRRLGFDLLGATFGCMIAAMATAAVMSGPNADNEPALELIWAAVRWRFATIPVLVMLRPGTPDIRLLPISTSDAIRIQRMAYVAMGLFLAFITLITLFRRYGVSTPSAQLTALMVSTVTCILAGRALTQLSRAMPGHEVAILFLGGTTVVTSWAIYTRSILFLSFDTFFLFLSVVVVCWLLLAIVRMLHLSAGMPQGEEEQSGPNPMIAAVQRSLVIVATVMMVAILLRVWAVEVLGLLTEEQLDRVVRALRSVFLVLLSGYILYEAARTWARARFGVDTAVAGPASEEAEDYTPRSRLSTIIPFLMGSLLVGVVIVAVLLGLSDLGFNTAPILAGAGIFGLAISFGSQALIRDIVSGIFYMIDDAFRVGEYIETGRLKGTVEKIMLRSLRVRHQNGQFHTIPYGQLGAVTNYSRDWSTIKFNLSLSRESDLEKVRKTAKKCGQALLLDPEFGQDFILPLKLQGVAAIQENALICRFKFTVRPLRPAYIQREALKRLHAALVEAGVEFATHTVKVITTNGAAEEQVVLAAASSVTRLKPPSPISAEQSGAPVLFVAGGEAGKV